MIELRCDVEDVDRGWDWERGDVVVGTSRRVVVVVACCGVVRDILDVALDSFAGIELRIGSRGKFLVQMFG